MKDIDEKQLIRRLQDDNTRVAAFTTLVDAYKETLYWQIRRMVVSHDDADDVLQNTFIKAWTGWWCSGKDADIACASADFGDFWKRRAVYGRVYSGGEAA